MSGFAQRDSAQQIDGVADDNSVESAIFSALKRVHLIDDISKCHYQRCGRTDAGVSAFNQVISLYLRSNLRSGVEFVDEFDPSIPYNAPNPSNQPQPTPSSNPIAEFDYASVETAFFFQEIGAKQGAAAYDSNHRLVPRRSLVQRSLLGLWSK